MPNAYQVGVGGFIVTSLYVIILAFFWRAMATALSGSHNQRASKIGAAMGTTL